MNYLSTNNILEITPNFLLIILQFKILTFNSIVNYLLATEYSIRNYLNENLIYSYINKANIY